VRKFHEHILALRCNSSNPLAVGKSADRPITVGVKPAPFDSLRTSPIAALQKGNALRISGFHLIGNHPVHTNSLTVKGFLRAVRGLSVCLSDENQRNPTK
jgi:hypothetical protein